MTVEELLPEVKKLVLLLEDAHPGLLTWQEAFAAQMERVFTMYDLPVEERPFHE